MPEASGINAFFGSSLPVEAALRLLFGDHLAPVELPSVAAVADDHRALLESAGLPFTGATQSTRGHFNTWFPPGTGWPEVDFPEGELPLRELDGGLVLAIELSTGAVVGRTPTERSLVNTSIGALFATLLVTESVWQDVGWSALFGVSAVPVLVRDVCVAIDPPALASPTQHWPRLIKGLIAEMSL